MPTICDLKIELKKLKVKGISGKPKAELERMLNKAKNKPDTKEEPKPKKETKKKETKKEVKKEPPKLLKFIEEEKEDNLSKKSYQFLKKKVDKLKAMVDDISTTGPEKSNANKLLKKYEDAMNKAKERQYGSKKKK